MEKTCTSRSESLRKQAHSVEPAAVRSLRGAHGRTSPIPTPQTGSLVGSRDTFQASPMQKMQEDPEGLTQVGSSLQETQLVPPEGMKNHPCGSPQRSHELSPYIQELSRGPGLEGIPVTILPFPLESKRKTDSQGQWLKIHSLHYKPGLGTPHQCLFFLLLCYIPITQYLPHI